jgi:hypothetical protein
MPIVWPPPRTSGFSSKPPAIEGFFGSPVRSRYNAASSGSPITVFRQP